MWWVAAHTAGAGVASLENHSHRAALRDNSLEGTQTRGAMRATDLRNGHKHIDLVRVLTRLQVELSAMQADDIIAKRIKGFELLQRFL